MTEASGRLGRRRDCVFQKRHGEAYPNKRRTKAKTREIRSRLGGANKVDRDRPEATRSQPVTGQKLPGHDFE